MRKPHETQQQEHQTTKNRIPLRNMALVRQTAYAMPANINRAPVQACPEKTQPALLKKSDKAGRKKIYRAHLRYGQKTIQ